MTCREIRTKDEVCMDEDKNSTGLIALQPKKINEEVIQTVDARDLYKFLEVDSRFNDWIALRIREYDFVENQDYVRFY